MRQYAIDKEFELGVEATNRTRCRGYCRRGDCPWSINARLEHKGWGVVIVSVLNDVHDCTSSGQRRTSTPTTVCVADKTLPILMLESELGAKKLHKRLQEKFNVVIEYDTVWKGKEKAMTKLYGTWEENFPSKWFCDTSTGVATGAAQCGFFVGEGFGLLVVSYMDEHGGHDDLYGSGRRSVIPYVHRRMRLYCSSLALPM
jgi:hypothetical protein